VASSRSGTNVKIWEQFPHEKTLIVIQIATIFEEKIIRTCFFSRKSAIFSQKISDNM
jgi:hypothetical protein